MFEYKNPDSHKVSYSSVYENGFWRAESISPAGFIGLGDTKETASENLIEAIKSYKIFIGELP